MGAFVPQRDNNDQSRRSGRAVSPAVPSSECSTAILRCKFPPGVAPARARRGAQPSVTARVSQLRTHHTHARDALAPRLAPQDAANSAVLAASSSGGDSFVDLGPASLGGVLSAPPSGAQPQPGALSFAFALQLRSLPSQQSAAPAAVASFTHTSGNNAVVVEILPSGQLHCYFSDNSGRKARRAPAPPLQFSAQETTQRTLLISCPLRPNSSETMHHISQLNR